MDLDPDTLAAIKSDAYAELGLELGWGDDDDGTRDLKHDIVNALVPFIAAAVERATKDGLADRIAAELDRTMFESARKIPEVIVALLQSLTVQ